MASLVEDGRRVWHPFTPIPHLGPKVCITAASGAYLFDETGTRYFDATSSWWSNIHGHCHPRLVAALESQAALLDQILFAPHTHPTAVDLASRLVEKLGPPFSRVFYSDDGSTAVEAALKIALGYFQRRGQRRTRFVSLTGGYHGDTLGAVSVGGIPTYHDAFPRVLDVRQVKSPTCFRCPEKLTYPSCDIRCAADLHLQLDETVAALVIEPMVMGAAGMVIYPKEYLEIAVSAAKRVGALVIFDEVFTGFGRTGPLFAMEHVAARPDIVCLAKGLTGGMMPLAATVTTEEVYAEFTGSPERAFYHGHTFTANALGCAVALASLELFDETGVLKKNHALSGIFLENAARFKELPTVLGTHTMGMIWAVETDLGVKELWALASKLWQRGIWMRPLHQTLYVVPPYCTTPDELGWVFDNLFEVLKEGPHV